MMFEVVVLCILLFGLDVSCLFIYFAMDVYK